MSDPAIADFTVNFNSPVFWDFLYRYPAFIIEKSAQRLAEEWFGRMEWIVRTFDGEICQQMVYSELHNLFIAIEQRIAQLFPPEVHDEKSTVWSIPDRLNALLDQHIHHERSVKFYASELCLSPDYLNKVCHRLMKTSTKALINDTVIYELKRYLAETDLAVEEIAARMYELRQCFLSLPFLPQRHGTIHDGVSKETAVKRKVRLFTINHYLCPKYPLCKTSSSVPSLLSI